MEINSQREIRDRCRAYDLESSYKKSEVTREMIDKLQ